MGGLAVTLPSRPMGLDDKPTKDAIVNRPSASPEGARLRVEARWRLLLPGLMCTTSVVRFIVTTAAIPSGR
jgi:hypothetical protein